MGVLGFPWLRVLPPFFPTRLEDDVVVDTTRPEELIRSRLRPRYIGARGVKELSWRGVIRETTTTSHRVTFWLLGTRHLSPVTPTDGESPRGHRKSSRCESGRVNTSHPEGSRGILSNEKDTHKERNPVDYFWTERGINLLGQSRVWVLLFIISFKGLVSTFISKDKFICKGRGK